MRKVLVPLSAYAVVSMIYLSLSGAPLRVHALSLSILAVAILVPSMSAARFSRPASRLVICGLCAIAAILAWDASAHFVIAKAEPFFILLGNAWLYLIGGGVLASLSFGIAWAASPPNHTIKLDAP